MENNNSSKEGKNFFGYTPSEMKEAKPYSKYLLAVALVAVFTISGLSKQPLDLFSLDWYLTILVSSVATVLVFILVAMLVGWVVRSLRGALSASKVNRFDYLAMTAFVLAVLFVLAQIDQHVGGTVSLAMRYALWAAVIGFVLFKAFRYLNTSRTSGGASVTGVVSVRTAIGSAGAPQRLVMGVMVTVLLGGAFWWYEVRPVQIKKECSWVERVEAEKPADPGLSAEEAERLNVEALANNDPRCSDESISEVERKFLLQCQDANYQPRPASPSVPEKRYYVPATEREYEQCLRQNGL